MQIKDIYSDIAAPARKLSGQPTLKKGKIKRKRGQATAL
jgi:hypothetical protein